MRIGVWALAGFDFIFVIVAWIFEAVRPARMSSAGLCFAISSTKVAPRPFCVTPVVSTIFPAMFAVRSDAMVEASALCLL
jgi:hypothetical protein